MPSKEIFRIREQKKNKKLSNQRTENDKQKQKTNKKENQLIHGFPYKE
jgi:hypothetical protein